MTRNSEEKMMTLDLGNAPQRRAYDTLVGVLYSLNISDHFKEALKRELDLLYESWFKLHVADKSGD